MLTTIKTVDPSYEINGHINVYESCDYFTIELRDLEYPNGKFDIWIELRRAIKLDGTPDFKTYFISPSKIVRTY